MTLANYTPEVYNGAKTIRKIVNSLTLGELIALKEILAQDGTDPEAIGVREPRKPKPSTDESGATIE